MKKSILAAVVAAAAGYALLGYHIILQDDTITFLKKTGFRYEDTFVDARGPKKLELLTRPKLIEAGIRQALRQVE